LSDGDVMLLAVLAPGSDMDPVPNRLCAVLLAIDPLRVRVA